MLTIITPPGAEPISLADARVQCRASSADDAFLTLCIKGARAACEGSIRRALINRVVEQTFSQFDDAGLELQLRPLVTLTSVKYDDVNNNEQTLSGCQLDVVDDRLLVLPPLGTSWPTTKEGKPGAVRVRWTAGYGTADSSVPDDIRTWLLLAIGYLYAQREAFDMTGKVAEIPNRFHAMFLDPFRVYGH